MSPAFLSSLSFCCNRKTLMRKTQLRDEEAFVNAIISSNINEGIKAILFFQTKRFHTHEKHRNSYKRTKTKKAVLNALKKTHLRGRKSFVRLHAFLRFLCAFYVLFCAFCAFYAFYAFYGNKKDLSESRLFAFCAFCAFLCFLCFLCA